MGEDRVRRVAEFVQAAMAKDGHLTANDAAAAWGLSVGCVRRLLAGRTANPSPGTMTTICKAAGVCADEFYRTSGIPNPVASSQPRSGVALGATVKDLRTRKGVKLNQLAELAGVGKTTLSALESGYRRYIRADQLDRLEAALELPGELWALVPGGRGEGEWVSLER